MTTAVSVNNLGKLYRVGKNTTALESFCHNAGKWITRQVLRRRVSPIPLAQQHTREEHHVIDSSQREGAPEDYFWALKDVSFEVPEGGRIGIIGKNGSGKSTLLKILSRITAPTTGDFEYRGRMVSLLEVGTGFQPELSGRENIYLNGLLNGMTRRELDRRFDEIWEFSDLGDHIDTPVKRYSSGMYMRLAFSVAAHLDSEILIVDEVLAVGDAGFQKKCSDKMLQLTKGGRRTLLFVSHSMDAVMKICDSAIELSHGRVVPPRKLEDPPPSLESPSTTPDGAIAPAIDAVLSYVLDGRTACGERSWEAQSSAPSFGNGLVVLHSIRLLDDSGGVRTHFDIQENAHVEAEFTVLASEHKINFHIYLHSIHGAKLFCSMDNSSPDLPSGPRIPGRYRERCTIPTGYLNEGLYSIEILICANEGFDGNVSIPDALSLKITDKGEQGGARGDWQREWWPSLFRPVFPWKIERLPHDGFAVASQVSTPPHTQPDSKS
ncbi:ABC transporter ATP-binding protein [Kamptonema cortianum]|nr:ABC transporter ATP-binding protein [Oscillatoria laete-virens]MDK3155373.1 ABC transporter ATP-binding protein [Kamptonema cortianum]MDL5046122.1 ABC transporter ATP-binding protein [Oscillatoria amoena NRMC-F 0135]MDL5052823.1 ABC transporter ATP-binding protein [Oscillatoria laete-virens NRMC-F 0139]